MVDKFKFYIAISPWVWLAYMASSMMDKPGYEQALVAFVLAPLVMACFMTLLHIVMSFMVEIWRPTRPAGEE